MNNNAAQHEDGAHHEDRAPATLRQRWLGVTPAKAGEHQAAAGLAAAAAATAAADRRGKKAAAMLSPQQHQQHQHQQQQQHDAAPPPPAPASSSSRTTQLLLAAMLIVTLLLAACVFFLAAVTADSMAELREEIRMLHGCDGGGRDNEGALIEMLLEAQQFAGSGVEPGAAGVKLEL